MKFKKSRIWRDKSRCILLCILKKPILLHVKINLSLCLVKHNVLRHVGSGSTIPHILNLGARWKWFVGLMRHPLYPVGKSSRWTSKRRLVKVRCRRKSNPDSFVIHLVVCSAVEPSSTRLLLMACRNPPSSSSPGNMWINIGVFRGLYFLVSDL